MIQPIQLAAIATAVGCALGMVFGIELSIAVPILLASVSVWIVPVLDDKPKYVLFFLFAGLALVSMSPKVSDVSFEASQTKFKVSGQIVNVREISDRRAVFDMILTSSEPGDLQLELARCYTMPNPNLSIGETVSFYAYSKKPQTSSNPGEFDFSKYLSSNNIKLMLTSFESPAITGKVTTPASVANSIRQNFDNVFESNLSDRYSALLDSMVFGRRELPDDISRNFSRTGTSHIVAASGFNISIISFSAYFLMLWITGNKKSAIISAIIIIIIYSAIAGFSPSVSRAMIMALMAMGAQLLGRRHATSNGLATAILILLAINPLWIADAGFQLSFVSTFCLFVVAPAMFALEANKPFPYKILSMLVISICIQILSLPIITSNFHTFSTVSPFANLIVIPITTILTPLGALAAVFGSIIPAIGSALCFLAYPLLVLLDKSIELLASPTWSLLSVGAMSMVVWIPYYLATLLGLALVSGNSFFKPKYIRIASVIAIVFMVSVFAGFAFSQSGNDYSEITFLDVGHGDAIFVKTKTGKTMLVDGGGGAPYLPSGDTGARIVLPFLRYRGVNRLDFVIATHRDQDHIGGLFSVIRDIPVGKIFDSGVKSDTFEASDLEKIIKSRNIEMVTPAMLETLVIDDFTKITFLGPPKNLTTSSDKNNLTNNNSIAAILEMDKVKIMLSADIQTEAMTNLLGLGNKISADICKLPHHGGYAVGFSRWFEMVNPKLVINSDSAEVGTGSDSRTEKTVEDRNNPMLSTARFGAITIRINDGAWSVENYAKK
jgi:competence protein ComEC